jgi:hypothetical protein
MGDFGVQGAYSNRKNGIVKHCCELILLALGIGGGYQSLELVLVTTLFWLC